MNIQQNSQIPIVVLNKIVELQRKTIFETTENTLVWKHQRESKK